MTSVAPSPLPQQDEASPASDIIARRYAERAARFAAERDRYLERWNRLANIRLVLFLVAACIGGWALWLQSPALALVALGVLLVFGGLVRRHGLLNRERRRYAELAAINDEARRRHLRAWRGLPLRHRVTVEPDHPYAVDLDIFGRASVLHLLEGYSTHMGETVLADWLRAPAPPASVRDRQAAVAELAPQVDFRDEFACRARQMGQPPPDPEPFLQWAEGPRALANWRLLVWTAHLSPVLLWALIALQFGGVLPYPTWAPLLIVNLTVWGLLGGPTLRTLSRVWVQHGPFRPYADLMELLTTATFTAPSLRYLQERLSAGNVPAHVQMRRLHRLTSWAAPPTAPFYFLVQMFTLWDVHLLDMLERWQTRNGAHVRGWLTVLGEADALVALAVLRHDNPAWVFPEIDPATPGFEACDLGHPLLPDRTRVVNDVVVGPPGSFLLVTGSNMSGKSTLLRAIGVNIVLAGAGGPVCATWLRLPPVRLWTSMRVQDSLEQGVSYFMAELQRLKQVVDAARAPDPDGRLLLYLLDEILQGTNTAERQVAARRIVGALLAAGAIGAVSTHDLTLADAEPVRSAARAIHFIESFTSGPDGPSMTFDYRIRPGIATTTNALKLMQMVGLSTEGPHPAAAMPPAVQSEAAAREE